MLRYFILLLLPILPLLVFAQTSVVQFSFNETTGTNILTEPNTQTILSIQNPLDNPEFPTAPRGQALRLDGYGTYAQSNNFAVPDIEQMMAIELWYATEAFNAETAGLVSQITGAAGFTLKVTPFGNLLFQYHTNDRSYFLRTPLSLPVYQWNHIVAQVDLAEQRAEIWVNGMLWAEQEIGEHERLDLAENIFYIGRGNDAPEAFGFLLSAANGALDELNIYNQTLTSNQIEERFNAQGIVATDLAIDPNVRFADDHLRPQYHVMPNTSWTNEAYGLTYYDGKYHLFSQKNPNAPILYFMHWGHFSSPDLVNWTEEKMALRPEPGFSDFGKWSGTTTFDENGEPVILFTGVDGQKAGVGVAYPQDNDLIEWQTAPENPVVARPPSGFQHKDFRDPYVWQEGDTYYMVVGSGLQNNGGGILFSYKSTDLINWETISPVFRAGSTARDGTFWEMPAFFPLNEKDYLFVVTPQYNGRPADAVYWVGEFVSEQFRPYQEEPRQLEHLSRHLLAPAFGRDAAGRITYIGIIPEDRNVEDQIAAGWRQTFSVPRVIRLLEDGNLGTYPHPNLCRLQQEKTQITNRIIEANTNFNLTEINGNQQFMLEMEAVIQPEKRLSLQVLKNETAERFVSIDLYRDIDRLGLNRLLSSPFSTTENNRWDDYVFRDTVLVQVFVDHSTLEVFVDNLAVMSARVYPGEDQFLVDAIATEGGVEILRLDYWTLGSKEQIYEEQICEPTFLPDRFFTEVVNTETIEKKIDIQLFPNPAQDKLRIQLPTNIKSAQLSVFRADGQLVTAESLNIPSSIIDVQGWETGVYFLKIKQAGRVITKSLVIAR